MKSKKKRHHSTHPTKRWRWSNAPLQPARSWLDGRVFQSPAGYALTAPGSMRLWSPLPPNMPASRLSADEIAQRLTTNYPVPGAAVHNELSFPPELLHGTPRPAAVLIPLLRKRNSWHVLFIRRTTKMAEHSGQVAFPGGRADPGDADATATALREAHEEIGLNPGDVRILGGLQDFLTITNYRVTPMVGLIPWPYRLRPAGDEVSRIFSIPLSWLADPGNREERQRNLPVPGLTATVIHFKSYDNEVLWGASASIMVALLKILD